MTLYKPVKSNEQIIDIKTETGHIIKFKIIPKVFVDLENTEKGQPFFFVNFDNNYEGVESNKKSLSIEQIKKKYKNVNLLTEDLNYDHIQIGFIYAEGDSNNHRWMLNFMDVNNKHLFNYIADNVKVNCPFTTTSWEDGIWHGRFVVYKKDIVELLEPKESEFILNGKGIVDLPHSSPLDDNVTKLSLRYNIHSNMWFSDLKDKSGNVMGEIPCKNIICDVPFEGSIDRSTSKPKVTAELDASKIAGTSLALNALIIKKK